MQDEKLFIASLKVASSILTNLTVALLIEIPFLTTWVSLTSNTLFCILGTIIAIRIERYLLE
jgi:allophanate hydrolase subunit 2